MASTNAEILNTIWSNASVGYRDVVPSATASNYSEIADILDANPELMNEFLGEVMNKIVVQRVYDPVDWAFPFKEFVKEVDPYGDAQELLGFDVSEGTDYSETSDLLTVNKPSTSVSYISTVDKKKYKVSFNYDVVKGAIIKEYALTQMVNTILKRMRVKNDITWYKRTLADLATIDIEEVVGDIVDDASAKDAMTKIIRVASQMSIPNKSYNKAGYDMALPVGNAILILNTNAKANLDVRVYASLLNSEKINDKNYFKNVYLAEFDDTNTVGYILEGDSYLIVPRIYRTTSFFDASNLITNYWLHSWTRQGLNKESQMVKLVKTATAEV